MTPPEVAHRRALAGIAYCGARHDDGAKLVIHLRDVTCPKCWVRTEALRLRAMKAR